MIDGHDTSFMCIQDLVTYFKRNKSGLAVRLRRPLREVNLKITAGYHYARSCEIERPLLKLKGRIIGKV